MGKIRNNETDRILTILLNNQGVAYVGLVSRDRRQQQNRSVARLVAEVFLPQPRFHTFDTPINLDGDRTNNCAINLAWRPRWFAVKYHQQFNRSWLEGQGRVHLLETDEVFDSVLHAARKYGLLAMEVFRNAMDSVYYNDLNPGVWPEGYHFKILPLHTNTRRIRRI